MEKVNPTPNPQSGAPSSPPFHATLGPQSGIQDAPQRLCPTRDCFIPSFSVQERVKVAFPGESIRFFFVFFFLCFPPSPIASYKMECPVLYHRRGARLPPTRAAPNLKLVWITGLSRSALCHGAGLTQGCASSSALPFYLVSFYFPSLQ